MGFAFYGAILGRAGYLEEAHRYEKLAFRILERYPSDVWMSRCLLITIGAIKLSRKPLRDNLDGLMTGHRLALNNGDFEVSLPQQTLL